MFTHIHTCKHTKLLRAVAFGLAIEQEVSLLGREMWQQLYIILLLIIVTSAAIVTLAQLFLLSISLEAATLAFKVPLNPV